MDSHQYTKKLRFQFGALLTILLLLLVVFVVADEWNVIYLIGASLAFGGLMDVKETMENNRLILELHRKNAKDRLWAEVCKIEAERRQK